MGGVFSSSALFDTPMPQHESQRRGSGVQHRSSDEPARGRAFASRTAVNGNLYSDAIDFRPGVASPVDAPRVAAVRARMTEGKGGSCCDP